MKSSVTHWTFKWNLKMCWNKYTKDKEIYICNPTGKYQDACQKEGRSYCVTIHRGRVCKHLNNTQIITLQMCLIWWQIKWNNLYLEYTDISEPHGICAWQLSDAHILSSIPSSTHLITHVNGSQLEHCECLIIRSAISW